MWRLWRPIEKRYFFHFGFIIYAFFRQGQRPLINRSAQGGDCPLWEVFPNFPRMTIIRLLIPMFLLIAAISTGQSVTTVRNAKIKDGPYGRAHNLESMRPGEDMKLLVMRDSLGYLKVQSQEGTVGWVYARLVSRTERNPSWWVAPEANRTLEICSFNIKWLGHYGEKKNQALVNLVRSADILVVQEVVTPPFDGRYCSGPAYSANEKSRAFFDAMTEAGFLHYLSCEDTGKTNRAGNSSSTEWFVVFYRPEKVRLDSARTEFLSSPRAAHPVYERVPHRFQFKTIDNTLDFSLISVHLASAANAKAHRKREVEGIVAYVESRSADEKDFFVLGDMNFQKKNEVEAALPDGWKSLNEACAYTNVAGSKSGNSAKPYDHVLFRPVFSEVDFSPAHSFRIQNLFDVFYPEWAEQNPADAEHSQWANKFSIPYSDHFPIYFTLRYGMADGD